MSDQLGGYLRNHTELEGLYEKCKSMLPVQEQALFEKACLSLFEDEVLGNVSFAAVLRELIEKTTSREKNGESQCCWNKEAHRYAEEHDVKAFRLKVFLYYVHGGLSPKIFIDEFGLDVFAYANLYVKYYSLLSEQVHNPKTGLGLESRVVFAVSLLTAFYKLVNLLNVTRKIVHDSLKENLFLSADMLPLEVGFDASKIENWNEELGRPEDWSLMYDEFTNTKTALSVLKNSIHVRKMWVAQLSQLFKSDEESFREEKIREYSCVVETKHVFPIENPYSLQDIDLLNPEEETVRSFIYKNDVLEKIDF